MGSDGFVFLMAVLCVTAVTLGLAGRGLLIRVKEREIRKAGGALMIERAALEQRANELEALQADIDAQRAALADLATQALILSRRGRKRAGPERRFVHEIGRGEAGRSLFTFTLAMAPGFTRRPDAKAILHPDIWSFENEARVWATDFPAAQMLTRTIFNESVGVTVGTPEEDAGERRAS